jgi:acetyl esterase/lipase
MAGWLFLLISLAGTMIVVNAAKPRRGTFSLVPSWLLAFLTLDLAPFHIALALVLAGLFALGGALESFPGKLALFLTFASSAVLFALWLPSLRAASVANAVAAELELDRVEPMPRRLLLNPIPRLREGVTVTRDVPFSRRAGRVLKMDIYRGAGESGRRPGLVFVHGGGWVLGDKREQGLPLCNHLATLGWVCANANYRLSPGATYPDHVVDARDAVAWLREHSEEYGVDPNFIAIAGNSAGAHIAAMTALTDDAERSGDTSVQAIVTCYGVYDLTNRLGVHGSAFLDRLIGPYVLKAFYDTEPERFHAASPMDHVDRASIPWLMLQGDRDSLTPVPEAREFARRLREHSRHPVGYAEFPGAQHAFDIYYSLRTLAAVDLSARFLATAYRRFQVDPAASGRVSQSRAEDAS